MSVALAVAALTATTANAADIKVSADAAGNGSLRPAAQALRVHPAMTRAEAQAAGARLDRLLGARPAPGSIEGSGILVVCGDGLPSPGETCDDGNTNNNDGCSSTCQIEIPFACTSATGSSPINDEGFELGGLLTTGAPNPNWAETGTQPLGGGFFTPICNEEVCLGSPDANLALEGEHFAWFGGFELVSPSPQVQTLTQTRSIATGRPTLAFYTLRGICHSGNADNLVVTIDNNVVFTQTCNATDADWVLQTINLATAPGGPYNNGANHTMKWTGTTRGGGDGSGDFTNIFVDFVNLSTGTYPAGVTPVASVCNNDCGNSEPNGTEQCDDGNNNNGDGCSADCEVEEGFICTPAIPGGEENAIQDGSFEEGGQNDGGTNPFWAETFTSFPPICSEGSCGADVSNTGLYFLWNGGGVGAVGVPQTQTVTQTNVVIPTTATTFDFFTLRGICSTPLTDNLRVQIDGNTVFTVTCTTAELNYVPQSVNLATAPGGPYNDGDAHTIVVTATTTVIDISPPPPTNNFTNIFFEDAFIGTGDIVPPQPSVCFENCYSEDFGSTGNGDLTGWTVFNTGALDVDWGTTDDGICGSVNFPAGNYTGGDGEAACVDSDHAGAGVVDAYLCSPLINYGSLTDPFLQLFVNYQVFGGASAEDLFEILQGTAAPSPGTIGGYTSLFSTNQNLGALAALPGVVLSGNIDAQNGHLCFHYVADFDWYAMVDNVSISAPNCDAGDTDGDGLNDNADNCKFVDNNGQPGTGVSQNDTDGDGIGNMCDADFQQSCTVDFVDLGELKSVFFQSGNLEENMDGTGAVDFLDLGRFKGEFFKNYTGAGNPSGIPNVCNP